MKMKSTILILIVVIILFLSTNIVNASRPYSVPCVFEAEVIDYKTEIHPENNIEEIELTLKILSYGPPAPESYWQGDDQETLKQMCPFPSLPTIKGSWYPPGQPYTQGREPDVDKNKVLTIGSTIKGGIDSYDSIITNVSLVKEAVQQDKNMISNEREDNTITNKKTNYFVYIIIVIFLVIVLFFFIWKYKHK